MKILFYLIILLACYIPSQAQKIRFDDTANAWSLEIRKGIPPQGTFSQSFYHQYRYNGDTLINGLLFNKLYYDQIFSGYIHYDSNSEKVLYSDGNSIIVLYDYNLSLGDTVYSHYKSDDVPGNGGYKYIWHVVDRIDSIPINGVQHKVMYFKVMDMYLYTNYGARDYVIIEGIGCMYDLLYPLSGASMLVFFNEIDRNIICFRNNGNVPNSALPFVCNEKTLNVQQINNKKQLIYPQPAISFATIELPSKTSGSITVVNSVGASVYKASIDNQQKLTIPHLPSGIYFYKIWSDATEYNGKLVFE